MIPYLDLGFLRLPTYGLMLATAFLVAAWVAEIEFRRKGLGRNVAWDSLILAMSGGIVGARVNYLLEHPEQARNLFKALFSGVGLTWYGGFVLGLIAVLLFWRFRKVRLLSGLDAAAPSLALGYAIARIGCLLSGDGDYGIPTSLPWGMAFPDGLVPTTDRVHPTPIYETVLMGAFFLMLWRLRRKPVRAGTWFWVFLVGHGLERFLIEFIRRNQRVFLGLTEAQLVSIGMIVAGVVLLLVFRPKPTARPAAPPQG